MRYTHPWIAVVIARRKPEWHRTFTTVSLRLGWGGALSMARTFLGNRSGETHHYTITLVELD